MLFRQRRFLLPAIAFAIVIVFACATEKPPLNPQYNIAKSHHTPTGFKNNYPHLEPQSFWQWQWERWKNGVPIVPHGGWRFPLVKPDVAFLRANRTQSTVTWIGHSTVLLQLSGVNILTDPHFTERASPVPFAGPKRWVPPALGLDELPHIDVVLISHNHYDHLDLATVKELARQAGGPPRFYVPLGLARWFRQQNLPVHAELDWWDRRDDGPLAVHLVPVQHWSTRTPWDRNETLWGGFVVEAPGFRFICTGDTGYSADFKDIAKRFGSFDLAALPIGAYAPRWFMQTQHVNPAEAVQIHRDLNARQSLAVHWGTFALSDEPLDEPPQQLAVALVAQGVARDSFWVFAHGETRTLGKTHAHVAAEPRDDLFWTPIIRSADGRPRNATQ